VLPYEIPQVAYSPIGVAKWSIDRTISDPQTLTISKQFHREFLHSVLHKSRLFLAIEFFALDETFKRVGFDEF
jgi:hypothetical protein